MNTPTFEQIAKTVTQSLIALFCIGVIVWAVAIGKPVEPAVIGIAGIIVGWYFGKNNVMDIAAAIMVKKKDNLK